jgi:hypothetical protein
MPGMFTVYSSQTVTLCQHVHRIFPHSLKLYNSVAEPSRSRVISLAGVRAGAALQPSTLCLPCSQNFSIFFIIYNAYTLCMDWRIKAKLKSFKSFNFCPDWYKIFQIVQIPILHNFISNWSVKFNSEMIS